MKVYCKDCKYYRASVFEPYYWCKAIKYERSSQIQKWYEYGNPFILNNNNDCTMFKPKLIRKIYEYRRL
jgi:hypothetical protein